MVINHFNNVVRLYDETKDNPNELNVGRVSEGYLSIGIEDRDEGNTQLFITISEAQLLAAIAVTKTPATCEDCRTRLGHESKAAS